MLNPEIAANRRPVDRLSTNAALAALAERVQPIVAGIVSRLPRPIRDLLHGTPLGHPLHPAITDVPIGAWTVTAVLDGLELAGGPALPGADAALVVGLAGAGGAIASGYADWSDTSGEPRTLGMAHAMLNVGATVLYLGSLAVRRGERRRAGLVLSLAGYGLVATAAYLGGELSYGEVIGPKHTAEPIFPGAEFTPVLAAAALTGDAPVRVDFGGLPVLVTRVDGGVAAISAICTHRGAPLDQGEFDAGCVTCPWHGSRFSLADGAVLEGPASFPQARFDARINGDQIEVRAFSVGRPADGATV